MQGHRVHHLALPRRHLCQGTYDVLVMLVMLVILSMTLMMVLLSMMVTLGLIRCDAGQDLVHFEQLIGEIGECAAVTAL